MHQKIHIKSSPITQTYRTGGKDISNTRRSRQALNRKRAHKSGKRLGIRKGGS